MQIGVALFLPWGEASSFSLFSFFFTKKVRPTGLELTINRHKPVWSWHIIQFRGYSVLYYYDFFEEQHTSVMTRPHRQVQKTSLRVCPSVGPATTTAKYWSTAVVAHATCRTCTTTVVVRKRKSAKKAMLMRFHWNRRGESLSWVISVTPKKKQIPRVRHSIPGTYVHISSLDSSSIPVSWCPADKLSDLETTV